MSIKCSKCIYCMLYAFEVGFILLFAGIMVYAQKNQTNFNTLAESNGKKIVI